MRIYHSGDTAIFSDLKLIGELYRPNIGLLCACEIEKEYLEKLGLKDHYGNEMNGDEGALAAIWLGLEVAILCHYLKADDQEDLRKFFAILESRCSGEPPLTRPLALQPGEVFEYPGQES